MDDDWPAWRDHRRPCSTSGSDARQLSEAEDVVQEAFARLARADSTDRRRGGLAVVVASRLCLDRLRSAAAPDVTRGVPRRPAGRRRRRPADRVTLDDSVRIALQLVWNG